MKPIKTPKWIDWLLNPKYCVALLKLKWQRLSSTQQGRKLLRRKLWIFAKRNALMLSVILLTVQITYERSWRREAELQYAKVDAENSFIRGVISMRNSDFQNFPRPWWEKIKKGNDWRLLDLNRKYEIDYKFLKSESLGKSNEEFFGEEVGKLYSSGDLAVWLTPEREIIRVEPLTNKTPVLVYKYGRLSVLNDSITSGFTLPLDNVLKAIDEYNERIKK